VRPPFLDDVSATQARRRTCGHRADGAGNSARAGPRTRVIGHEMSRRYVLEYPVDDPDEDDDVDEDDEGEDEEDDEDTDEEEIETWQVSDLRLFP
jgi:hypothetical protein